MPWLKTRKNNARKNSQELKQDTNKKEREAEFIKDSKGNRMRMLIAANNLRAEQGMEEKIVWYTKNDVSDVCVWESLAENAFTVLKLISQDDGLNQNTIKSYHCYPLKQNDGPNSTICGREKNYALSYTRQNFRNTWKTVIIHIKLAIRKKKMAG